MANVYVEARPEGRVEGSAIDDYHALGTFKTQAQAIEWDTPRWWPAFAI